MTIRVYRFTRHSIDSDETLSHSYGTMAFILLHKLTALSDSGMDVDPAHVDPEGRYLGLNGGKPPSKG